MTAFVRYHHERFDGNGYPDNLKGEALEEILKCSGTQFDPDVVRAFRSVFDQMVDINLKKTELMKRRDKTTD